MKRYNKVDIVFVDMDNTIAENKTCQNVRYYKGLYEEKRPIKLVIKAIETLYMSSGIPIVIISKVNKILLMLSYDNTINIQNILQSNKLNQSDSWFLNGVILYNMKKRVDYLHRIDLFKALFDLSQRKRVGK